MSSLLPKLTLKDLQKVVISQGMESLVSSKLLCNILIDRRDLNSKQSLLSFFNSILPYNDNSSNLFSIVCRELGTPFTLDPEISRLFSLLYFLYSPYNS